MHSINHNTVTFRLDGRLEISESDYDDGSSPSRRFVDVTDPLAILECLDASVRVKIEPGVTLRNMIGSLSPWKQVLSRISGFDLSTIGSIDRSDNQPDHSFTHILAFRTVDMSQKDGTGHLFIYGALAPTKEGEQPDAAYTISSYSLEDVIDLPIVMTDAIFDPYGARTELFTQHDFTFNDFLIQVLLDDLRPSLTAKDDYVPGEALSVA